MPDMYHQFIDYVESRARIWAEKYIDGREPNYRGDVVLSRFHFCNVWRELDRYSRWEIARIRNRPLAEQIDVIVVGRLTMVPKTIERLLAGDDAPTLRSYVAQRRADGLPWYNTALQVQCRKGADYVDMFVEHRDAYLRERDRVAEVIKTAPDSTHVAAWLNGKLPHVGPFRAYEIATSLTYSEAFPNLVEEGLFHVGPGAISGLELITGFRSVSRADFEKLRQDVLAKLKRRRKFRWIPPEWQGNPGAAEDYKFTLRTLEDCLCEFRKYQAFSQVAGVSAKRRTYQQRNIKE